MLERDVAKRLGRPSVDVVELLLVGESLGWSGSPFLGSSVRKRRPRRCHRLGDESGLCPPESLGGRGGGDSEFVGDLPQGGPAGDVEVAQFVRRPERLVLSVGEPLARRFGVAVAGEASEFEAGVPPPERREPPECVAVREPAGLSPARRPDFDALDDGVGGGEGLQPGEVVEAVTELCFEAQRRDGLIPACLARLADSDPVGHVEGVIHGAFERPRRTPRDRHDEHRSLAVVVLEFQRERRLRDRRRDPGQRERVAVDVELGDETHTSALSAVGQGRVEAAETVSVFGPHINGRTAESAT